MQRCRHTGLQCVTQVAPEWDILRDALLGIAMKRRPLLFLWLAFTSLAWGATGLLTLGALAMTPMIFTSRKAVEEPQSWWFIGGWMVLVALIGSGLVLQWVFFSIKKDRLAGWMGAIPVVVFGLLTKSMFLPWGWNSDDFTHHTLEPSAFPNHEVTLQVHCPNLEDDATLHVCIYPFIEGESELGLPMQWMGEGRWDVTFRYPTTPFVFNYNLGDRKHAAMVNNGTRRPNVGIDLVSDTLLFDTIPGWLDMAPTRPHLSGVRLDLLNHTRRHTTPLATGLDTTFDNTAEAP